MAQIFISYSHQNAERVRQIATSFEGDGYSLWWDTALRAGVDYGSVIETELHSAQCVVVVWSASARNSIWVRAEASEALERNKLVQVTADGARPPLPFTMVHLLDISGWRGDRQSDDWRALDQSVRSVVRGDGMPASTSTTRNGGAFFAPMVAVGAGSIGLVAVAATLTATMASSLRSSDVFGTATFVCFGAACLGLAYMLMRTVEIGLASRRPA